MAENDLSTELGSKLSSISTSPIGEALMDIVKALEVLGHDKDDIKTIVTDLIKYKITLSLSHLPKAP